MDMHFTERINMSASQLLIHPAVLPVQYGRASYSPNGSAGAAQHVHTRCCNQADFTCYNVHEHYSHCMRTDTCEQQARLLYT